MEQMRKPFQGVVNIIRFNWHFYVLAIGFLLLMFFIRNNVDSSLHIYIDIVCIITVGTTLITLLVSFYIYDLSGLYKLNWIQQAKANGITLNINAGFDETSTLINDRLKPSDFIVLDFYNPQKHTEISIKRARKAYPPFPGTMEVNTNKLPFEENSADNIFVIFSAHEIRNDDERILFFQELKRILKPDGEIYVVEHLRDTVNFMAYNIGFFHFHSKESWKKTFRGAGLNLKNERKITPFISNFTLVKNGTAA